MFGALPHRHTHRGPFDPGPLPLELPDLRAQVRRKIVTGQHPQMIMRLGRTGRTTSSPRRPAGEVLTAGSRPADRARVARTGDHRPLGAGATSP
jgi:hypothetical protein